MFRHRVIFFLMICASAIPAFAGPRIFVDLEASPPTAEAYLLRVGFSQSRLKPFFGMFHWQEKAEDKAGWDLRGETYAMGGLMWQTTSNPAAKIIPSLGGGMLVGDLDYVLQEHESSYVPPGYPNPLHVAQSDVTTALGCFADIGVRVPLLKEQLSLTGNLHWNLSAVSRTQYRGDFYGSQNIEDRIALLSVYLMIGASYQF